MDKYELRDDVVPLKETQGANKWWNRLRAPGDKTKWTTLEHNGILFPAEYVPHGIPLLYDGTEIPLAHDAEEVASMWATMLETAVDFTRNPTFAKNFFRDFRALLPKDSPIKELSKCDFDRMKKHLTHERETTKLIRKTDKDVRAREKKEKDVRTKAKRQIHMIAVSIDQKKACSVVFFPNRILIVAFPFAFFFFVVLLL